jgi:hypothetical protein
VLAIGARTQEHLSGSFFLVDAPARAMPLSLSLVIEAQIGTDLLLGKKLSARGVIQAEGLASRRSAEGSIVLWFRDRRLTYDLLFLSDDGKPCRLLGEKDLDPTLGMAALGRLDATLFYVSLEAEAYARSQFAAYPEPSLPGAPEISSPLGVEFARARLALDFRRDGTRLLRSLRPFLQLR